MNKKAVSYIILVITIVLLVAGAYVLYNLLSDSSGLSGEAGNGTTAASTPEGGENDNSSLPAPDTGISETSSLSSKEIDPILRDASNFLPKPYMKYIYEGLNPDGKESSIEAISGVFEGKTLVSIVELIPNSEAMTVHFTKGYDGIYSCLDEEYNLQKSIWLVNDLAVGRTWTDENIRYTVKETGVTYDLGFIKVENCIIMEADYYDEGMKDIEYIAPGYGVILVKDSASGKTISRLTSAEAIAKKDADEILIRYSPKITGNQ